MNIEKVRVGFLQTNCYIISKDDKCLIIDPGDEANKILDKVKDKEILGILITHHHFDHVGALNELKYKVYDNTNVKKEMLVGPFKFETIVTKGHSSDSITYYFKDENVMFVGDFIFKENIGRTDLETGNMNEMKESIKLIKTYPNVTIYPGHGESTTLDYEINNNIYFNMP